MNKLHQIYFLRRQDGLIKIGTTTDLAARITMLSTAHGPLEVVKVINGDRHRERSLHTAFRRFNAYGEWFNPVPELLAGILSVESGDFVDAVSDARAKNWAEGERQLMAEARSIADRLVRTRCQFAGVKERRAEVLLSAQYGFSDYFIRHIRAGKASTISAYGLRRLRASLISEMETWHGLLLAEIAAESAAPIEERRAVK
jgi:hypothetical protein